MKLFDFTEMGHALWREMGGANYFRWSRCSVEAAMRKAYKLGREAQHEATWAMAMNKAANINSEYGDTSSIHEMCGTIRALPCPPLTPTESE